VDDVLEFATLAAFPTTGETGKIYVSTGSNKTYRWSGSSYVEMTSSPGSTDAITEGSTNLYFTAARAVSALASTLTNYATQAWVTAQGFATTSSVSSAISALVTGVSSVAGKNGAVTLSSADVSGLAPVATSGAYADLSGKPTIPAATTDASLLTSGTLADARLSSNVVLDAPSDGTQYARKDAAWEAIQTGNPFDQSLNTTDDVAFNEGTFTGNVTFAGASSAFGDFTVDAETGFVNANTGFNAGYLSVGTAATIDQFGNAMFANGKVQFGTVISTNYLLLGYNSATNNSAIEIFVGDNSVGFANNTANLNADGSASFANGAATIDSSGNASFAGLTVGGSPVVSPVNADWNATSGLAQILNKPTIPAAQVNSNWNATSGLSQILNKPTIPAAQVNSDWNASSGVSQILNKPILGTLSAVNDAPSDGSQYVRKNGSWAVLTGAGGNPFNQSLNTTDSPTFTQLNFGYLGLNSSNISVVTDVETIWQIDSSGSALFKTLQVNGSSVATLTATQTLTNKTLTAPVISNGSTSTILTADAANILSVANSTSASGLRVFNTRTDASNYERGIFDWTTNANNLTIGTQNAGTGTARRLRLQSAESVDIFCGNTTRAMNLTSSAVNIYNSTNFLWYSATSDPTTSSVPFSNGTGTCAVMKNTTSGVVKLWVRDGATMKSVTLA
jgi:hypothetical protein